MTSYPAGPYQLSFQVIVADLSHDINLNCDTIGSPAIGTPPLSVQLETRDGSGTLVQDAADDFWGLAKPYFNTTALASTWTLWKCNPLNSERDFITGGALTSINGGVGTATSLASQLTLTWRSALGNILKMVFLETVFGGNQRVSIGSTGNADITAMNAFVLSGANFIMARDRSFPIAGLNMAQGQNEKVFNRRFRS